MAGREYREVRFRFDGDIDAAKGHIPLARKCLGIVKEQMMFNKLLQLTRKFVFPGGLVIIASSIFGHDTVQVMQPVFAGGKPERQRIEKYTPEYRALFLLGGLGIYRYDLDPAQQPYVLTTNEALNATGVFTSSVTQIAQIGFDFEKGRLLVGGSGSQLFRFAYLDPNTGNILRSEVVTGLPGTYSYSTLAVLAHAGYGFALLDSDDYLVVVVIPDGKEPYVVDLTARIPGISGALATPRAWIDTETGYIIIDAGYDSDWNAWYIYAYDPLTDTIKHQYLWDWYEYGAYYWGNWDRISRAMYGGVEDDYNRFTYRVTLTPTGFDLTFKSVAEFSWDLPTGYGADGESLIIGFDGDPTPYKAATLKTFNAVTGAGPSATLTLDSNSAPNFIIHSENGVFFYNNYLTPANNTSATYWWNPTTGASGQLERTQYINGSYFNLGAFFPYIYGKWSGKEQTRVINEYY